jgi:hypothetical protein
MLRKVVFQKNLLYLGLSFIKKISKEKHISRYFIYIYTFVLYIELPEKAPIVIIIIIINYLVKKKLKKKKS